MWTRCRPYKQAVASGTSDENYESDDDIVDSYHPCANPISFMDIRKRMESLKDKQLFNDMILVLGSVAEREDKNNQLEEVKWKLKQQGLHNFKRDISTEMAFGKPHASQSFNPRSSTNLLQDDKMGKFSSTNLTSLAEINKNHIISLRNDISDITTGVNRLQKAHLTRFKTKPQNKTKVKKSSFQAKNLEPYLDDLCTNFKSNLKTSRNEIEAESKCTTRKQEELFERPLQHLQLSPVIEDGRAWTIETCKNALNKIRRSTAVNLIYNRSNSVNHSKESKRVHKSITMNQLQQALEDGYDSYSDQDYANIMTGYCSSSYKDGIINPARDGDKKIGVLTAHKAEEINSSILPPVAFNRWGSCHPPSLVSKNETLVAQTEAMNQIAKMIDEKWKAANNAEMNLPHPDLFGANKKLLETDITYSTYSNTPNSKSALIGSRLDNMSSREIQTEFNRKAEATLEVDNKRHQSLKFDGSSNNLQTRTANTNVAFSLLSPSPRMISPKSESSGESELRAFQDIIDKNPDNIFPGSDTSDSDSEVSWEDTVSP